MLVGLALGLAVLLAVLARPWLESLTGLSFSLQTFADPYMLAALVGIGLGAAFEELAPGSHTLSAAVGRFLDVGVEGLGDGPEGIGVVEDLHLASLHRPIEPTAFFLLPTLPDTCYLHVEAGEMGQGLAGVEEAWHRFLPNAPSPTNLLTSSSPPCTGPTGTLPPRRLRRSGDFHRGPRTLQPHCLRCPVAASRDRYPEGRWDLCSAQALLTVGAQAFRPTRIDPATTLRDE